MALTIPGFEYERLNVDDPVELNVAIGGSGRPVVLLHGFPQTHLMWRHVAIELASNHTVICPDLRGYGESDKPPATDPTIYSKRTMAADVIALARRLGHDQLALVGHDRGALVAIRAGLEHPESITHLASLDVLPTLEMWDILHGASATVAFHMYLTAQPPGLPETMISASADTFFGHFLDAWSQSPDAIPPEVRNHYLTASANAVPSIVADYRASAGIDLEHDTLDRTAGRQLTMPVTVIQQDWGAALGFDAHGIWRSWAPNLEHRTTRAGHFMAEEAPRGITTAIRELLDR